MSTSTLFTRVGACVLKSHGALVLMGAVVLLAGASCNSATVSSQPNGGQAQPGGNDGGGGSNGGSMACIYCGGAPGGSGGGATTGAPSTFVASKTCGDGVLDPGEDCDDGVLPAAKLDPNHPIDTGCNAQCLVEANFICPEPNQPCVDQRKCGNSVLTSDETCDDGNTLGSPNGTVDGCSADCQTIDPGWQCRVPGKPCTPICGDSKLEGNEMCDDGNTLSDDGCSSDLPGRAWRRLPHAQASFVTSRSVETESRRQANPATAAPIRRSFRPAARARTACSTATAPAARRPAPRNRSAEEQTGPGRPTPARLPAETATSKLARSATMAT